MSYVIELQLQVELIRCSQGQHQRILFGVPRVGLRASRAVVGGAAQGRDRPIDGG